jgi:hypothetical protein
MPEGNTRREFLRAAVRTAGLLGLGGLVWSAASRFGGSAGGTRTSKLPCERCPALTACTRADSLQARDALGGRARPTAPANAARLRRLCDDNVPPPDTQKPGEA